MRALKEAGIRGATIIPSSGMASRLFGSDDARHHRRLENAVRTTAAKNPTSS
ncbi:MAG: hypothetical protein MZU97_17435 [Bacillus subtilis]|nr:hypothetical protein [Bacillus subtilis]